ncbi:hypothetical protein SAMN05421823_109260 [Catalinimonas alkaloidigena]|uniref:Succinylglutamate desuccinylase/Aspartoacylase catalytic domain-containing protein n=1 Tax=Catalinimonas alkaloidigena TaxID=1075417 RepID=A0A1G9PQM6_9BACT|nr:succinylglutamate desuccinylase/aspartoacylase family protein [Catalinimonas alkaloidigena]SDM00771.1 hypothetical protein SAMN05421823_109260 [Catalinimonas alkaloidigena]
MPNQVRYSFVRILTGSDLSNRRLPFMQAESSEEGPLVWMTACGHGDEVGGIVIIQEVFKWIKRQGLRRGKLMAFPLMNPMGFETASRQIIYSQEDLNRSFPGNPKGSLAERIAEKIFTSITQTKPSLVLDLHNDWIRSIPYTLLDVREDHALYQPLKELATHTGFPIIYDTDVINHSLSFSLVREKIPALTLEVGGSYAVNERDITYGVSAMLRVLHHLGMINYDSSFTDYPLEQSYQGKVLLYSTRPLSSNSGIIRFLVQPGNLVRAGQPLAKIYNTFGKLLETLKADRAGLILGLADSSVSFPGMPVAAIGYI